MGVVLAITLTGCSASPQAAARVEDAPAVAAQKALTDRALAGLAARTCPTLPTRTRLAGLPKLQLDCLGSGPQRSVAAGDGRPTVVNLWASWCRVCVREMPLLQRTSARTGSAARFVGIDTEDERASAAGLLDATGVRYPSYEDPRGRVRSAVRAVGLPVTIVYDGQGREVARRFGAVRVAWLEAALRRAGVLLAAPRAPASG